MLRPVELPARMSVEPRPCIKQRWSRFSASVTSASSSAVARRAGCPMTCSALRGVPREVRDLTAAARNSWLVCFDNLSRLPEELADAACRLSTGGGFGGRQLYSDHDEAIFDATRPLVFNAIPDLGTARPDFLDRALIVEFLSFTPEVRRDEAAVLARILRATTGSWVRCSTRRWRHSEIFPRSGSSARHGWRTSPRG